ncbi:hypothetical protein BRX37_16485 [Sphingomonas sp. S-NIH.Pt3_0716]|nr:hypothetical protein BRX37_16485 [Sphingomonas sp. S-NIH.Pt3_0716]
MSENIAFPMPRLARRNSDLRCPHCKMPGLRRSSQEVVITLRQIFYSCPNPFCAHSWKASLSYEYGTSPSAIPCPEMVDLPLKLPPRDEVMAAVREARLRDHTFAVDPAQIDLFTALSL